MAWTRTGMTDGPDGRGRAGPGVLLGRGAGAAGDGAVTGAGVPGGMAWTAGWPGGCWIRWVAIIPVPATAATRRDVAAPSACCRVIAI